MKEDFALSEHLDSSKGRPQPKRVKYKKPTSWQAGVDDKAIPAEDWSGGSSYVKRWRRALQPGEERPSDPANKLQKRKSTVPSIGDGKAAQKTLEVAENQENAKLSASVDDIDDLEFLRRATAGNLS